MSTCSKAFTLEVVETSCPDWDSLLWGVPSIGSIGAGVATFTPDSIAQDNWNTSATALDGGVMDAAVAGNAATVVYNGSGCDCNVHVVWTSIGDETFNAGFIIIETLSPAVTLFTHGFTGQLSGITDYPFSIPDTSGTPVTIQVTAQVQVPSAGTPGVFSQVVMIGTISNVP